ncbi:MAG: tetratricopeptide repeat protein [Myxococcota bacterium]
MSDSNVDVAALEMAFAKDPTSDAFLALSSAYLDQGRFMEAMVVCKKGIKSRPDNVDGRLLLARVYAGQGKVPKAIEEVNALLEISPSCAAGHLLLGQLHERSGRFEEAVTAFKTVLEHDPKNQDAVLALKAKGIEVAPPPPPAPATPPAPAAIPMGAATSVVPPAMAATGFVPAQGRAPVAPPTIPPAAPIRPSVAPASMSMATAQSAYTSPIMGGYDPLAMHAARKKGLGPGFTVGLGGVLVVVLALIILGLRSYKERAESIAELVKEAAKESAGGNTAGTLKAVEKLQEALKLDDEQETVVANLAYLHAVLTVDRGMRDREEPAKQYLALAQKVAPEHPYTIAARLMRALYQGADDEANAAFALIEADLNGGQPKPVLNVARGMYLRQKGRLQELAPVLENLRNTATEPNHLAWLSFAYRAVGDRMRARLAADQAVKLKGDNDPARSQRALLIMSERDIGNIPIALDDLTTLQDLGKNSVGERQWGYLNLARGELSRFNQREQEYQRDIAAARSTLGTKDPELLYFEARALIEEKKLADAVAKLQEAVRIDRHRLLPWVTLVQTAVDADQMSVAEQALSEAKQLFPDHVDVVVVEVYLLAKRKDFAGAKSMLGARLAKQEDAELRAELGRVLLASGEMTAAVEELRKAAEGADKTKPPLVKAAIYTLLGRALANSNDDDNAVEAYSAAIGSNAAYADAYYYLGGSLQRQSRNGPAREAYEKYLKLDPSGSKADVAKERVANLR